MGSRKTGLEGWTAGEKRVPILSQRKKPFVFVADTTTKGRRWCFKFREWLGDSLTWRSWKEGTKYLKNEAGVADRQTLGGGPGQNAQPFFCGVFRWGRKKCQDRARSRRGGEKGGATVRVGEKGRGGLSHELFNRKESQKRSNDAHGNGESVENRRGGGSLVDAHRWGRESVRWLGEKTHHGLKENRSKLPPLICVVSHKTETMVFGKFK